MYIDFHHHHYAYPIKGIFNVLEGDNLPDTPYSIGIHPMEIKEDWEERLMAINKIAQQSNCLAIGECGLDGIIDVDEKLQKEVFLQQIKLAQELEKPLIIHCVRRYYECLSLLKGIEVPVIFHGFNKNQSLANEIIRHGFYLSFGASLIKNLSLQEILTRIPKESFFLETDDSEISIKEIYNKATEVLGKPLEDLCRNINTNWNTIFYDAKMAGENRASH